MTIKQTPTRAGRYATRGRKDDPPFKTRRLLIRVLGVLLAIAALGLATPATAGSAVPVGDPPPVADLTAAQQQELQTKVTNRLKDYGGGKQINSNQISYMNGTLILTLALPGEERVRAIDESLAVSAPPSQCLYAWACIWSDTNFGGDSLFKTNCGVITLGAPFNGSTASIYNHQTTGTQTVIMNANRQILNASLAPSKINDTGVGSRSNARYWRVC